MQMLSFFFESILSPPTSTLFPYTTLFRSQLDRALAHELAPTARPALGRRHDRSYHGRSEEHTSELQSQSNLVCRLLLEKKKRSSTVESALPSGRRTYRRSRRHTN